MKIKLNQEQLIFIEKYLRHEQPELYEKIHNNITSFVFDIDKPTASTIRDWCGDKLQLIGFDSNWKLNSDGKIIDDLIDKFYSK